MRDGDGQRLVIVGASLAGVRAAEAARARGHDGPITLIGGEPHLPYDRPPLSKAFLAPDDEPAAAPDVPLLRLAAELHELRIEVMLGEHATALDPERRTVQVGDAVVGYDALVVATGATPRSIPTATQGVHVLRTVDDARAIRAALDDRARTVVVGAGFIGLEVASAALARGLPVTVVEASDQPLIRSVGPQAADLLIASVRASGANLVCGRTVTDVRTDSGRVASVELDDGSVLPAELVVCGIGATPAVDWLSGSGLLIEDGVVCDLGMATSVRGVWAAGDVARVRRPDGTSIRIEHWTAAAEEGVVAGTNAAAFLAGLPPPRESSSVPYFWSELFGSKFQMLGTSVAADQTSFVGEQSGPWMMLYGRGGRTVGVLTRDLPGRIMKFRALIANGEAFELAVDRAAEVPVRAAGLGRATIAR